jgi:ParB-like chromosome segregation protein Spo0J
LAFDIKRHGLQQPLVIDQIDGQMMLIDGRNRRIACLALGIVPDYVLLDGHDPVTYILSANINRRHMSKGQRAIVVATLLETSKVPQQVASKQAGISQQRISQARTILRHASDLADSVRNGSISIDNAYEEARIRKGRAETHESRFNALKAAALDLADMVTDGQLNLEEAQAALDQRVSQEDRRKKGMARCLHELALHADLLERQREQVTAS